MWKQIVPADNIFIHGENSSWEPHPGSGCTGSGPMQVQTFKKAAASELPSSSVGCSSAGCSLPAYTWSLQVKMFWGIRKGHRACREGYGEGTEMRFHRVA